MTQLGPKALATGAAAALVALGVGCLVPGVTSPYRHLAFAGHGSTAKAFGLFRASILLGLLYLVAGVIGLVLARSERGGVRFLTGGGIAFLALWALGVVRAGGWIPLAAAVDWLNLGIGAGLLGLAHLSARRLQPVGV